MKRKVTIKDIAAELNTSIGTVDRALHNRPGISEKTRQRILGKVKELGYEPNTVASSLARKRVIKLGCVYPGEYQYFYPDIEAGICDAENKFKDYNVQVIKKRTSKLGASEEKVYIQELIDKKVSAIALCTSNSPEICKLITLAEENNIAVITLATDVIDSKRRFSIGTDSFNNGQIAGDLMKNFTYESGKVAIITGYSHTIDHTEKVKGFLDVMGGFEILGPYEGLESSEISYEITKKIIAEHDDLQGIYINNANNASVCQAVVDADKAHQIIVIGTDLNRDNKPFIEKGIMQASIFQNPYSMGYEAIHALYKLANGTYINEKDHHTKLDILMRHNLRYFKHYDT